MSNQSNATNNEARTAEIGAAISPAEAIKEELAKSRDYITQISAIEYDPNLLVQYWPKHGLCVAFKDGVPYVTGIRDAEKRTAEQWRGAGLCQNGAKEQAKLERAETVRRITIEETERTLNAFAEALKAAGQAN